MNSALLATSVLVAFVAAGSLFKSIVRSTKGVVWKNMVAAIAILVIWTVLRLAYQAVMQLP